VYGKTDLLPGHDMASTYSITKTLGDKKLKVNESIVVFTFKCEGDKCAKKGIKFTLNGKPEIAVNLNAKGMFAYKLSSGKSVIRITSPNFHSLTTDSILFDSQKKVFITITLAKRHTNTRKPVIYLYPQKSQDVSIQLDYNGQLDFTYPLYNKEWNVTANPDGTIEANDKKYNYLFWDGKMETEKINYNTSQGSIVNSKNLVSFLEESLTALGLNSKETADFITYWVPQMMNNENNFIHFLINNDYDQIAKVKVIPQPESMMRIFMLWHAVENENVNIPTPQRFTKSTRKGFTYVEWGGSEMPGEKGM